MFKRDKNPKIEFIALNENHKFIFDPPVPASTMLPEWYKKQNKTIGNKYDVSSVTGNVARTIKACMPVFDIIAAGYFIKMPAEAMFYNDSGSIKTGWSIDGWTVIDIHNREQYNQFSVPDGYSPYNAFKFNNPWIIKTPPGYSTLFIQPSLRDPQPFYMVPAIVDTDKHPSPINFPFFLKEGFEGSIPFGEPIIQAIPFKREEWSSLVSCQDVNEEQKQWQRAKRQINNRYKDFFRSPKVWK